MKKKAAIWLAIVLAICLTLPVTAFAQDESDANEDMIVKPMWTYINLARNSFSINGSGLASMSSEIACYTGTVDKVKMDNYLQRYQNNSWSTVNSWSQITYDDNATWSKTSYVSSGYSYRLVTYFYAYDGSTLLESTSRTSASQYY